MAAPNVGRALRVPGRLAFGPTDLSTAWPHGGTGLGLVKDVSVKPNRRMVPVKGEAYGNETVDMLDLGETWTLAATLRDWDADALQKVFVSTAAGATTGERYVQYPSTFRAGTLHNANGIVLLFTPDDQARQPAVLFYQALPMLTEQAELALALDDEMVMPVVFTAIRNGSGNMVAMGLIEDLSL